jgi:hypothetical protein
MHQKIHKVIATNRAVLECKYGSELKHVDGALTELVAADKDRGLNTAVLDLADPVTMKKYHGKAVTTPADPKQNKAAIDKIYQAIAPEYLMILGAMDVVPHQDLINPLFDRDDPFGDPDQYAYSDLPYACDRAYSQKIEDFTGATRVLGRLPDITGGSDASYLARLLAISAAYRSRPGSDYADYLGISAKVWQNSTGISLRGIFGTWALLQLSPPKGPRWPAKLLGSRSHFINCHGAPADPHFYGQDDDDFPIAHNANYLDSKITEGTMCAAECCYGAELYDPKATGAGHVGICNTYLGSSAYGFFGSSTVAYGPADKNAQADVITQDFFRHVLSGASSGRAALQARQDFVMKSAILDPFELKTLAQFNLMGDPSIHPVERTPPDRAVVLTKRLGRPGAGAIERLSGLGLRRDTLRKNGLAIAQAANYIVTASRQAAPANIRDLLKDLMAEAKSLRVATFAVRAGIPPVGKALKLARSVARSTAPTRVHVAVSKLKVKNAPCDQFVAVVAREQDGALTMRKLYSR